MRLSEEECALSRVNLYEQIANTLEKQILASGYEEDKKLPSEQMLAEQFSVSRNVIREALKLLKERSLVDSRNGTGSYITKPEPENLADVINRMVIMDKIDYQAIYDVRMILETSACQYAAQRISEEQLEEMRQSLNRLRDLSISIEERRETDFDFHVKIAHASGNLLLEILVKTMKNVFIEMIEKGIFLEGGIEDACIRHEKILHSLEQHDQIAAKEAMREHLDVSKEHVASFMSRTEESVSD